MIVYVFKFSACLVFFILFYKFFLEKENMHQFKRFFLIGSIVFSLVIPMITFTTYVEAPISTQLIPDLILGDNGVENKTNYLPFILWSIYGFGVIIF